MIIIGNWFYIFIINYLWFILEVKLVDFNLQLQSLLQGKKSYIQLRDIPIFLKKLEEVKIIFHLIVIS